MNSGDPEGSAVPAPLLTSVAITYNYSKPLFSWPSYETGVLWKAGTGFPAWVHGLNPGFPVGSVLLIFLDFCVVFFALFFYSCDLCIQCFQCLWIAHSWLLLRFSLMFIYHIHVVRSHGLLLLSCFQYFVLSFWHANRESVSIFYVILLIYCLKVWNFNSLCKFCNWKMVKWIYLAKQF